MFSSLGKYSILGILLLVSYRGAAALAGMAVHEFVSIVGGETPQWLAAIFALGGLTLWGYVAVWLVERSGLQGAPRRRK